MEHPFSKTKHHPGGRLCPRALSLQEGSFPCQRQGFLELWSVRLTLWVKTTILKTIGMHCTWKK